MLGDLKRLLPPSHQVPLLQNEVQDGAVMECSSLGFGDLQNVAEVEFEPALEPAVEPGC